MNSFTIGVEEEFGLVDPATGRLVPAIEAVLASLSVKERKLIKPDVHQATLEIATGVCANLDEVKVELLQLRRRADRAAQRAGVRIFPAAIHPHNRWREQPLVDNPRYHRLAEHQGEKWLRCLFWGLHVHLGVPDEAERVRIANGLRPFLPLFIAFAANSPYWEGRRDTAADARLRLYSQLETVNAPPKLEDFADVDRHIACLADEGAAVIKDLYWDIRPRRVLPTVEIRVCDMQTTVEDSLALVGLILLAAGAVRHAEATLTATEEEIYANRAAAIQDGLNATISLNGEWLTIQNALLRFLDDSTTLVERFGLESILARIRKRAVAFFSAGRRYQQLLEEAAGDEARLVSHLCGLLLREEQ
ncbi:YbdK family carboxylate-amine ligase [bacterium]|nr:YbdK family carboxylate-amine ligase [bacterium]